MSENKTNQIVDAWFQKYIHNSPASRDEQVYAHLYEAKNELKTMLNAPAADSPPVASEPETVSVVVPEDHVEGGH